MKMFSYVTGLFLLVLLSGCAVNPVTGERQFTLMSEAEEIALGEKNFVAYQQQQGGLYTVDPKLTAYVNGVGQKVAAVSDRKLPYEFVVLNNDVPNAWALPGGKIAINRGLLMVLEDEAQLASVLGHEVVHAAARHGALQMTQQQILGIGVSAVSVIGGDSGLGTTITQGAALGTGAFQAKYGRDHEFDADEHGIKYMVKAGYDPYAAVELQELFVKMSAGKQANWLEGLFATHPPSKERAERNRAAASSLPKGTRNKAQYDAAMKQVRKDKGAYELHNQAVKANADGNAEHAASLVSRAIKQQPKEPLFHITQGQLKFAKKDYVGAEKAFQTANTLYPEYFAGQLGLGVAQYQRKNFRAAKQNLTKSMGVVPTVTAAFYLGEVYMQEKNTAEAVKYYQVAAQSDDHFGQTARKRLAALQGQAQPQPDNQQPPEKAVPNKKVPNKKVPNKAVAP